MKYLKELNAPNAVPFKESFLRTKKVPNNHNILPWAISPNITPNKKGKVIILNKPGFISLYLGTP
jgi:hypothetical protein